MCARPADAGWIVRDAPEGAQLRRARRTTCSATCRSCRTGRATLTRTVAPSWSWRRGGRTTYDAAWRRSSGTPRWTSPWASSRSATCMAARRSSTAWRESTPVASERGTSSGRRGGEPPWGRCYAPTPPPCRSCSTRPRSSKAMPSRRCSPRSTSPASSRPGGAASTWTSPTAGGRSPTRDRVRSTRCWAPVAVRRDAAAAVGGPSAEGADLPQRRSRALAAPARGRRPDRRTADSASRASGAAPGLPRHGPSRPWS